MGSCGWQRSWGFSWLGIDDGDRPIFAHFPFRVYSDLFITLELHY